MVSSADSRPSSSTTLGSTDIRTVPEEIGIGRNDKSSPGLSWGIAFIARAVMYRFILFTFDCSDVQPLLALFFWPGHVVALVLLLLDVYCRKIPLIGSIFRRFCTDSSKPIHGKLRTKAQLDLDSVFIITLLCSYWVKVLETMLKGAMAETETANNLPIDNNPTPPSQEGKREECSYIGDEIDLVLKAREVAGENGHSVVEICRWVDGMNAKNPRWEQKWRENRPLPHGASTGYGLGYWDHCEAMHLATMTPTDFDPRNLPTGRSEPSTPNSMAVNHPSGHRSSDISELDISALSGQDQKDSFKVKPARNRVINGFRSIPENCDDHLYPVEVEHQTQDQRKHQRRPQVEQQDIPVTYMALTAEGPAPNTQSWLDTTCNGCGSRGSGCCASRGQSATFGPSTCKPQADNGMPIDPSPFAGMKKRVREDLEEFIATARRTPVSAYMPLTPDMKKAPKSNDASKSKGASKLNPGAFKSNGGGGIGDASFKVAPSLEGWEPITSALNPDAQRTTSLASTHGSVSDVENEISVVKGSDNEKDEKDLKDVKDVKDEKDMKDVNDVKDDKVEKAEKGGDDGKGGEDREDGVSVVVGEAVTLIKLESED